MASLQTLHVAIISLLTCTPLMGCGESGPSTSTIKSQIASKFSSCKELSITNFKKVNGFHQDDGSYIEQVQYTLVFTPSNTLTEYMREFNNADKPSQTQLTAANEKAASLSKQFNTDSCIDPYTSDLSNYMTQMRSIRLEAPLNPDNRPMAQSVIDKVNATYFTNENSDEGSKKNTADLNNIIDLVTSLVKASQSQPSGKDTDNYIAALKALERVRTDLIMSSQKLSTCEQGRKQLGSKSDEAIEQSRLLKAKWDEVDYNYLTKMQNFLNKECPGGAYFFQQFNINYNDIFGFGEMHTVLENDNLHFINSDNGWLIQS